jgi:hypothetical protein
MPRVIGACAPAWTPYHGAMSGIMTRWLVLQEHPVTAADLDDTGAVSDDAVDRWVAGARSLYLDRCAVLRERRESGFELRHRAVNRPRGALLGRPNGVVVTASASEFRPNSFTISVRVRSIGAERDAAVNAACAIRLEDPTTGEVGELSNDVRDELIALEHSARHFN